MEVYGYTPREVKREIEGKIREYIRVLKISEKPDREEFEMSAKVTGAGIVFIGLIGFVFYMASNQLPSLIG